MKQERHVSCAPEQATYGVWLRPFQARLERVSAVGHQHVVGVLHGAKHNTIRCNILTIQALVSDTTLRQLYCISNTASLLKGDLAEPVLGRCATIPSNAWPAHAPAALAAQAAGQLLRQRLPRAVVVGGDDNAGRLVQLAYGKVREVVGEAPWHERGKTDGASAQAPSCMWQERVRTSAVPEVAVLDVLVRRRQRALLRPLRRAVRHRHLPMPGSDRCHCKRQSQSRQDMLVWGFNISARN